MGPFSRPESLSGILFRMGGLPVGFANREVLDSRGSFLALPDRVWPEYRVAYEYEGEHHRGRAQFRRDVHRVERLLDHGWTVVRATGDDLFDRPLELLERLARRLTVAGWRGSAIELRQFVPFGR